jgi:8-oxo-dGTP diphosphatase
MPASDQGINPIRYQVIPRVLIFVLRADAVLLIKLLPRQGKASKWAGLYNGPGGHLERGEDVLSCARRELLEETGLNVELALCGTVIVDNAGPVGIGLFIFCGTNPVGELMASAEGIPEWIPIDRLEQVPLVEDVAIFLKRIRAMRPGDAPFSGRSYYAADDKLVVDIV